MAGLLLTVLLLAVFCGAQSDDKCKGKLSRCLSTLPLQNPGGLPVSPEQIETLCNAYNVGNECIESWSKECLPEDTRKLVKQNREGVMLLMGLLCEDKLFKASYLNHTNCFRSVSGDWERCMGVFHNTAREVTDSQAGRESSAKAHVDLCCAKYGFNRCISLASRAKCDRAAAVMLRRISETLSSDSMRAAKCENLKMAVCSRGSPEYHGPPRLYNNLLFTVVIFILNNNMIN